MIFKNKLKKLLSLGAVNVGSSLILSLFWLFLASILSQSEYGEIGYLVSIANVGMAIAMMGFNTIIVVYESKKENVFPSSFLIVLVSAIVVAFGTFIFIQNILVSVLIIGVVIFNTILAGLNGYQRYLEFSIHRILRSIITIIIAIIGYYYFGINGILFGYFISTLFILKELNSLLKNKKMDFSFLKSRVPLMLHAYAMRLTDVFIRWGDKIVIASLFGFSVLAPYYFAVQYLLVLLTIPQSLSIYLLPQESQGQKNKKLKIFSILTSCLIALLSIFLIPLGITTYFPKFENSIIAMQILSIAIIPVTVTTIQESEFFGKENSRVVLYGFIIQSGFYLLSIILLGQMFGLIGFSVGFVIAVILRVIYNFLARKNIINFLS